MILLEPLILIPGLRCDARLWSPQVAALSHEASIMIPTPELDADSVGAMADRILSIAPPRFALAGASMGGYVALEVIRQAPTRVIRLALIATSARPETPQAAEARMTTLRDAEKHGMAFVARAGVEFDFHRQPVNPDLVETIVSMAVAAGVERFRNQIAACVTRRDQRPLLPTVTAPTLVICGRDDRVIPPERSTELAALIPNAVLHILPECGHAATLEQAEVVSSLMRAWISQRSISASE